MPTMNPALAAAAVTELPEGSVAELAWLVPVLMLASAALIAAAGKQLPLKGAEVGIGAVFVGWVVSLAIGWETFVNSPVAAVERRWLWSPLGDGASIELGIYVDGLTAMMLVLVTTVSLMVHVYSREYMAGEERYTYYYAMLSLFTFSMLVLVVANNTLMAVVGWELVGLCSYLLIGFYWKEKPNQDAANKAFLTTKFADIGLIVGCHRPRGWRGRCDALQHRPDQLRRHRGRAQPGHRRARCADDLPGLRRQVRPDATARLAAGRDGRADARLRADPRRHHGDRRHLPDRAALPGLRAVADGAQRPRGLRRHHPVLRRARGTGAGRHQEGAGLLDRLAARLHDGCARGRRLHRRHVPPLHARLLQGTAVPRLRLADPRRAQQQHERHGRHAEVHAVDLRHLRVRLARAGRLPADRRVLLQGRDPGRRPGLGPRRPGHGRRRVLGRPRRGRGDDLLHGACLLPDLLR